MWRKLSVRLARIAHIKGGIEPPSTDRFSRAYALALY
jgi:hypothetical protein